ncbi:methylated-DNA--[protein]-cysteine S-methyltransferase [Lactiplantibacillus paraplantarum]|uniref:methylated-DNA--[protein]-cysteine S-methyltransferase n=1 Tax=Lactiplantibacillus paraplantarum TaxID=60520 RepID=UPI0021A905DB|nr:methylated-DNA--[protein]-cysteine S-methyltransferase [Lactiplantibacillus paraplantarum]MCT4458647.1 methylated-DNA--[protein]-cysteine S-methyltransferase [Lactiplantibacillus paraplantarum]
MHLTLTQTTINQQTYWLGATPTGLAFVGRANGPRDEWQTFFKSANIQYDQQVNQQASQELHDYLTGHRRHFEVPLDQTTGTTLQQQVWQALTRIPYGQTATYSQLATMISRPTAIRAVASAVGKNPLLIIIPCHRVCRKDGQLGGYRGGLPMKRALLALENAGVAK